VPAVFAPVFFNLQSPVLALALWIDELAGEYFLLLPGMAIFDNPSAVSIPADVALKT